MTLLRATLDDKYKLEQGSIYLSAIQALVRLPMLQRILDKQAGHNTAGFISGYRGSPLGGYDKALWAAQKFLDEHHIKFVPGINEDLGATAIWGSQQVNLFPKGTTDGVFALWYGKGPGIDRTGDVFKHGNAAGSAPLGGVLVLAGDDHACRSSTLPHQSEYSFMDAMMPILNPAGIHEILHYGLFGIALSRFSGCWVAMKVIEETADSSASIPIDLKDFKWKIPSDAIIPEQGLNIRTPDTPLAQEQRLHLYKIPAVLAFARANKIDQVVLKADNPRLGIVTTGKAHEDVMQALKDMGITKVQAKDAGITIYKVGMSWPLEPEGLKAFALGLEELVIVEEKRGVVEDQIKTILYGLQRKPSVITGKMTEKGEIQFPSLTELTPALVAKGLAPRLKKYLGDDKNLKQYLEFLKTSERSLTTPPMLRIPYYCAGCPHNTSTVVPEGSRALAGIGCHYMVTWMDRNTSTFTQMGGEGVPWIGQAPFTETEHVFANLGDGTYFHSGILAIRAAVSAGVNITYKLLYNDAVAMTGGQPMDGPLTIPQLLRQLRSENVAHIVLVSDDIDKYKNIEHMPKDVPLYHRDDLSKVQHELREMKGTTVLVYDQTCAAEKRRRRKRKLMEDPPKRVFINEAVCEGCGDCGKVSNCVAIAPVETELGRKREIDQSVCNKDYSCVNGFCPSFVTVHGGQLRSRSNKIQKGHAALGRLPLPESKPIKGTFDILVTGVGGTGVVTIGALIGTAAHLEQKGCSVLDITGLAQKNGQVTCHVRLANSPKDIHAVRISTGNADVVIGSDYVVTAHTDVIEKMREGKTTIILDPKRTMAGDFTQNPDAVFPEKLLHESLVTAVGEKGVITVKAHDLATELMGDSIFTNSFLLGYAYQQGLIPLSHQALEKAIELNGASVEKNLIAFKCGRWAVTDYPALIKFLEIDETPVKEKTFEERLIYRREFLKDYQNQSYADRFTDLLMNVEKKDAELGFDKGKLTLAVMKYYFKLLAYKDEYEVARLYSHPDFNAKLKHQFEGAYALKFYLAPPIFSKRDPRTGHMQKQEYGEKMLWAFNFLQKFKFLRGTWFDPFGHTRERREERAWIARYEEDIAEILAHLSKGNYEAAVEWASLPEDIRGYGHIKEAAMKNARDRRKTLRDKFMSLSKVIS